MLLARWPLRVCTDVYIYIIYIYIDVYAYVYTNLFACRYISLSLSLYIYSMLLRAPLHVGREARRKRAGASLM